MKSGPRVMEVFSGAGLLSYAFAAESFRLLGAVEIDPTAAATYAVNLGAHVTVGDVRRLTPHGRCEVLSAGVPCQGYSTLGKRDVNDPRNLVGLEVVRWARYMKPKVIVIENVPAFLNAPICKRISRGLRGLGYEINSIILNALDFGVPQNRVRSFTFATRARVPVVTYPQIERAVTVREAWDDLPVIPNGVNNHYAPQPSKLALSRMRVIPAGGDKRDVMRRAPHLAAPSWWNLQSEITDVWGRMEWERPSNTIRTALLNPSKGRYIHPEQHRVISLREAARLHTIPDGFSFIGYPTQIARQIGNSVPPEMGRAVARAVLAAL